MQFDKFISQLSDRLPFGVTFDVKPLEKSEDHTVLICGFMLNQLNDVTVAERWFFDIIDELNNTKNTEVQIEMKVLAAKLKEKFDLPLISDSLGLLFSPQKTLENLDLKIADMKDSIDRIKVAPIKKEKQKQLEQLEANLETYQNLLESKDFSDFFVMHSEKYQAIADLLKMIQSDISVKWVKLTFFMMSRHNGNWDMSRTAQLTQSVADELYSFLETERNGGVSLEGVDVPEQVEEETEEDDIKKLSTV